MAEPSESTAILSDASHPAWEDEALVALATYRALRAEPGRFPDADLVHEQDILQEATSWSALDHHTLPPAVKEGALSVRGTAFNALHRKYSALDFHVEGIAVGIDSDGNYFLRASVGGEGSRPNAEIEVLAMFIGPTGLIGAIRWSGHFEGHEDIVVSSTGHDPRLVEGFDKIAQVHLRFSAEPHVA